MMARVLVLTAALALVSPTTAFPQANFESSKLSGGAVVQGGALQSPKISPGIVIQNSGVQSSKLSSGIVTQNVGFQSSKLSVGVVVQVLPNTSTAGRSPLTHW